jgi:hypothetical protein
VYVHRFYEKVNKKKIAVGRVAVKLREENVENAFFILIKILARKAQ